MQITLKQSEIEVALKQYIVAQGINLRGKTVDLTFTAGRKETGILAELDINDAVRVAGDPLTFPTLPLAGFAQIDTVVIRQAEAVAAAQSDVPEVPQEPDPAEREDGVVPAPSVHQGEAELVPATKTTSLFG